MPNIYNKEGISFNNVIKPYNKLGFEGPFHPFINNAESDMTLSEYLSTNRSTANTGEYFTTNAIDIHWGGAVLPNFNGGSRTINTTSQLLEAIQAASNTGGSSYNHPSYTAYNSGLYKITVNSQGHITSATKVTANDLRSLLDDVYEPKSSTVTKQNLTNFSVSMNGWTYGGTASNPSVSGNTGGGEVTYKYKVSTDADSTYISTKPSNAGTYTVKATVEETTNYYGATATANFTIAKANINPIVSMSGWTYGGTASSPLVGGNTGNGAVTYKYKSTDAGSTYESTKPSNAGTYTVQAIVAETTNYYGATATTNFTIAKATPNITVNNPTSTTIADGESTTIRITSGGVLGSLRFSHNGSTSAGGNDTAYGASITPTSTPAASFDITITNNAAVTEQSTISTNGIKVTFTPSDSNNYNNVSDVNAIEQQITLSAGAVTNTYYQGTASETQIQNQSYINGLSYNQPTKPTSTVDVQQGYNLFIFPSSWGTPTLYEDSAHTFKWTPYTADDLGITNPSGKQVLVWEANSNRTVYIVW